MVCKHVMDFHITGFNGGAFNHVIIRRMSCQLAFLLSFKQTQYCFCPARPFCVHFNSVFHYLERSYFKCMLFAEIATVFFSF